MVGSPHFRLHISMKANLCTEQGRALSCELLGHFTGVLLVQLGLSWKQSNEAAVKPGDRRWEAEVERAGVLNVLVYSDGNPGSIANVSVSSQRLLMFASTIVFIFWGVWKTLCSFSWCSLLEWRHWEGCTADKWSSAQFIDQRREKLSSLDVSLLSLSLSDPPPHLVIWRKSHVELLQVFW